MEGVEIEAGIETEVEDDNEVEEIEVEGFDEIVEEVKSGKSLLILHRHSCLQEHNDHQSSIFNNFKSSFT